MDWKLVTLIFILGFTSNSQVSRANCSKLNNDGPGKVIVSIDAQRMLDELPPHIQRGFKDWVALVEVEGLFRVRANFGGRFDDHGFKTTDTRSVRINHKYRIYYVERKNPGGGNSIPYVFAVQKHKI